MTVTKSKGKMINTMPTTVEMRVWSCYERLQRKTGEPPTLAELGDELGMVRQNVHRALSSLEAKGVLERPLIQVPGPYRLTRTWRDRISALKVPKGRE